jgi:hypothetical protein
MDKPLTTQKIRILKKDINIALLKNLIADYEDYKNIPNVDIYNLLNNNYKLYLKNENDEYHDHIGI